MIDWVTAIIPCIHTPLRGGIISSTSPEGEVEWEVMKGTHIRGSHDSSIFLRSQGSDGNGNATHLFFDGNPSKFLQGHNVVGSDDIRYLMAIACARLPIAMTVSEQFAVMEGLYELKRVDVNYMFELDTLMQVEAWLHAAQSSMISRHGKASAEKGTVYLGKGSRRWVFKFYSKYNEGRSSKKGHRLAQEFLQKGFLEWSKNKIRAELMLRTMELEKLIDWTLRTKSFKNAI